MGNSPLHRCGFPGCRKLIRDSPRCLDHQKSARRSADRDRRSASGRGYTYKWQKASKAFLQDHPLCVVCFKSGRITAAECVDHIVPHRGDEQLFWDLENNVQALCTRCHNAKTARGE